MIAPDTLQSLVTQASRIVFFGGAGVSTESGIPDFRSSGGVYATSSLPAEQWLSRDFFTSHTEVFYREYRRFMLHPSAQPNAAHRALAEGERAGKLIGVITQNIDGLHQEAGSRSVVELHGSVWRNACVDCHAAYALDAILKADGVPRCICGGVVKPDVVLYGEGLDRHALMMADQWMREADLCIVGGTSLQVEPAAGFVRGFRGKLIIINQSATPYDHRAALVLRGSIGAILGGISWS